MASLTVVEQIVLWGPPIVALLVTVAYYVSWGKEPDERTKTQSSSEFERGDN